MPRSVQPPALDPEPARLLNEQAQRAASMDEVRRERGLAALFIATHAADVDDCRTLLDMLGLLTDPDEYQVEPVSHDYRLRRSDRR